MSTFKIEYTYSTYIYIHTYHEIWNQSDTEQVKVNNTTDIMIRSKQ